MGSSSQKRSLFVVDDDADHLHTICDILSREFKVTAFQTTERVVEEAKKCRPQGILLDDYMPSITGLALCGLLKSDERTKSIPVFLFSGSDEPSRRTAALRAGASDFIAKPYNIEELVTRISCRMPDIGTEDLVHLDQHNLTLTQGEIEVHFTALEFALVSFFLECVDQPRTRTEIIKVVWKNSNVPERTVDSQIVAVRKKLKFTKLHIKALYGKGYVLRFKKTKGT